MSLLLRRRFSSLLQNVDLPSSEKAIRHGAIVGALCGVATLAVVIAAMSSDGDGRLSYWNDPWMFLDALVVFGLSFGIHKRNRPAAITMCCYFVISKVIVAVETESLPSLPVALVFLAFFGRAAWATVAYHRIRKKNDPSYRPTKRWVSIVGAIVGVPAITAFLLALTIGMLVETGVLPDTAASPGEELSDRVLETLQSHGVISEDETVIYFYSGASFSILGDGNLFTDKRVISYVDISDESGWYESARYEEIANLVVSYGEGWLEDTTITVTTIDDREFALIVSTEEGHDRRFWHNLEEQWRQKR